MNSFRLPIYILITGLFFVMISCATPITPTGGPADREGPEIEYTVPETGTTNFEGRSFEFHFNEFVQRSSVQQAITVEPDLGIGYDISWKKKRMTITFDDKFPDSTTVIIKLGTDISDTRNNKMARPVTLAISTGNIIDSGKIVGKVLNANTGRGADGFTVFLYRQPWNLDAKANYSVRTDTGGAFNFSYLAEGSYKALVVDDRNRNKIWDPGSEVAFTFYRERVSLETAGRDTLDVLYVARQDTIAPKLQGVGLFSTNRMRLRFSENIQLNDSAEVQIYDSLITPYADGYPLYVSPREKFVVFARSSEPLIENTEYKVKVNGFSDPAGNPVEGEAFSFEGTSQEDTTRQRIISDNGEAGLTQYQPFEVAYAAAISDPAIIDSLVVIEGNVDFSDWPELETRRNKLYVKPQESWIDGIDYQFLIWNPRTQRRTIFEPEIWDSTEYGEIEINLEQVDSSSTYITRVLDSREEVVKTAEFSQNILLTDLPPKVYKLILFEDRNGNGSWDQGEVEPFVPPEKYYIQRGIRIQSGFTSEVNIVF